MRWMTLLLSLLCLGIAAGQQAVSDPSRLTLDRIFSSDEFRGEPVPDIKWLDSDTYTILQPSKTIEGAQDLVKVNVQGKTETLIPAEKLIATPSQKTLSIEEYELSKDLDVVLVFTNSAKVWRLNTRGDYWLYRRSTGTLTKLGGDAKPSTLMFAKLSPDGSRVGYVRENNLYVEEVDSSRRIRLTNNGSAERINGTFDWVYEEEFFCRDGWRWSPDSKSIAYWQLDSSGVKKYTLIDSTGDTYQNMRTFAYPKAGEQNSFCRIGVVSAAGGETKWMDVPGNTRSDFYLPSMEWVEKPQELVIRRINRLQNTVDVMLAHPETGQVRTILSERDSAWLDIHEDALEWIKDHQEFTWISEKNGWRQLFLVSRDGSNEKCVTQDAFDTIKVIHVDEKTRYVYYLASPDRPTQRYLYRKPLDHHGAAERLSPSQEAGWHDYEICPNAQYAVHTFSSFGKPPRVELISLPDHKVVRTLVSNEKLSANVARISQSPVEFLRVDIGDGIQLDGWLMKPAHFDPAKKYPVVFHVYGEPWGQEVTDKWGGNNHLWHLMLTQHDYFVACFDNRGTPCPRGRDWRKVVYRKIGTMTSQEQVAAAKELLKRPYLNRERVGVWGWSGGGSLTLNLMFRYPDVYKTGMAIAPVPDMRLYDTIYQERYMGLPQNNAEDYQQGSSINHAAGLQGHLLIVHGTGDDNCHYQGTEKLANKLIELNKPFTLMSYPNRSHSINEGKNTTRHLFGLLTQFLLAKTGTTRQGIVHEPGK